MIQKNPYKITDREYRADAFKEQSVLLRKKKKHLPAMGWNSWNAFGSGNTEQLTKEMADALVELGLDQLGYQYVVLDDGCYKPVRVNGKLANEEVKFPSGFRALSDYIHAKGLKFGMYNDIGTNLCAGAEVGTCFHEEEDAKSYVNWGVDFLKVDNCYYLWDNATFSDATNAKYVFAPNIQKVELNGPQIKKEYQAARDGILWGMGAKVEADYVTWIGTFDGTGPEHTPVGSRSSELRFVVNVPEDGEYALTVFYASEQKEGVGCWLQVAVGEEKHSELFWDEMLPATESETTFRALDAITIRLKKGENILRLMNHRRQENTLYSYAKLLENINLANPEHDMIYSICEWGKTQPQNWGFKVGDSWRILNDITFQVGADGDPGACGWTSDYTVGIATQYNKAVIMDEFSGLDRGWNDPDMLVIGMNGVTLDMARAHMAMWCMLNAPLMLGMDLRRVKKGDAIYQIIANEKLIALNQDPLGIQAKRLVIYMAEDVGLSKEGKRDYEQRPDQVYVRENQRVDILAKPLADGGVALGFFNLSEEKEMTNCSVSVERIVSFLNKKQVNVDAFIEARSYQVEDLWTGECTEQAGHQFEVKHLKPYGCEIWKVTANV